MLHEAKVTFAIPEVEAAMSLEVIPVTTRRELRRFIDVPWRILDPANHPQWVPPLRVAVRGALDAAKHPFYERGERALFLARRAGRIVGRIAAIANPAHNEFHDDAIGFFGFFECADDPDAAAGLLGAASDWLAARGLTAIRGPVSPSTNYECGVLVDGFEHHPQVMTPWNPPYYDALLHAAGLRAVKDLLGYRVPLGAPGYALPERYAALAARARAGGNVRFRNVDLRHWDRELAICWDVYNAAWEHNWGFVPMSRAEFEHMGRDLRPVLRPEWAFVAEVDGVPAGFVLAVPDLNRILKRIGTGRLFPTGIFRLLGGVSSLKSGRVIALGVKREYRSAGLFALFVNEIVARGQASGVVDPEASWILEDNTLMNRPLVAIGATPYRRWRLYEKPLAGALAAPAGVAA